MLRRIYWGELSVPFVFMSIVLGGHFGYWWLLLGFLMLVISHVLSYLKFKVFEEGFRFPTFAIHLMIGVGFIGLFSFFLSLWLSFIAGLVVAISYEFIQGKKKWEHFIYIDTWIDILGSVLGMILFIVAKLK